MMPPRIKSYDKVMQDNFNEAWKQIMSLVTKYNPTPDLKIKWKENESKSTENDIPKQT